MADRTSAAEAAPCSPHPSRSTTPSKHGAKPIISDEQEKSALNKVEAWLVRHSLAVWDNMQTGNLWQRMLKNTVATTITIILCVIPAVLVIYGKAAYLGVITTVFGHPGRRFGMMAEALILATLGSLLGTAWSVLGVYLSSLVAHYNSPAAYTVKAVFLTLAAFFHGYLRSHTPKLFLFVLQFLIITVVTLTSTTTSVSVGLATTILYPILTAVAILLIVNITIFPEFSSGFLGITTIETLSQTADALRDANSYFVSILDPKKDQVQEPNEDHSDGKAKESDQEPSTKTDNSPKEHLLSRLWTLVKSLRRSNVSPQEANDPKTSGGPQSTPKIPDTATTTVVELMTLTNQKSMLRAKLASCKEVQQECMFELAFAVLPPRDLKPVSDTAMKKLVANTISLIGACESKYALLGDVDNFKEMVDDVDVDGIESSARSENKSRRSSIDQDSETCESSHEKPSSEKEEASVLRGKKKKKKKKSDKSKTKIKLKREKEDLEWVKPQKEIESADEELLKHLLKRIDDPLHSLQRNIDKCVEVITSCLAYCYDVPRLPSGALPPKGIRVEELDIHIDVMKASIIDFDRNSSAALESASSYYGFQNSHVDVTPRMEIFLISSFLLNLRQAASHMRQMLKHSRKLVEKRQARHDRRRLWVPRINWRKWLRMSGEQDMLSLPDQGRKDRRQGMFNEQREDVKSHDSRVKLVKTDDLESGGRAVRVAKPPVPSKAQRVKSKDEDKGRFAHLRIRLADFIEAAAGSDDIEYALKLTIAVLLVSWPAFIGTWNTWFNQNRALWAALQLVLITEVVIGASIFIFLLRVVGTTIGCCWGLASFEAARGNRAVAVVMLVIGLVPSAYVQLGTQYVKAAMVCIISMCIVVLASVDASFAGNAIDTFLRRLIAFLIGGAVALVVEFVILPVTARHRLVESLAAAIQKISDMEACLAHGIESGKNIDPRSPEIIERFETALSKAEDALGAAATFLPFCNQEPRLKGSFAGLSLVYKEILYVLHRIIERMDNIFQLRKEYGSSVLEELNEEVYAYRRNIAGSITLTLFAVHEALTTRLPLPQFLPSARLAHLRVVNRVRELILENKSSIVGKDDSNERSKMEVMLVRRMLRQKFLSWNAASAGLVEVIEYLEELVDLTKLLVGANEFRSGLLTRPSHSDYIKKIRDPAKDSKKESLEICRGRQETEPNVSPQRRQSARNQEDERADKVPENLQPGIRRRRPTWPGGATNEGDGQGNGKLADVDLPLSLQRVRSRRIEEKELERIRSKRSNS